MALSPHDVYYITSDGVAHFDVKTGLAEPMLSNLAHPTAFDLSGDILLLGTGEG